MPDVGERERRGVVHAVAHHHHGAGAIGARHEPGHDVAFGFRGQAAERIAGRQAEAGRRRGPPRRDGRPTGSARECRARAAARPSRGHRGEARRRCRPRPPPSVHRDEHRAEAVGDDLSAYAANSSGTDAPGLDVRAVPDADVMTVQPARDPPPGTSTTPSTVRTTPSDCPDALRKARATACDDSASRARANWSAASSPCHRATAERPSVSVPVLSSSTVSTLRSRSRASGFLTKMPARAARISATDTASGTASPSAQGHATTSSATTRSSATAGPR